MTLGFVELSLLGCIILAFVPPAVIAAVGVRFSRRIDRTNDNLMTTLARFSGAALVFICAFLIGTLWNQTTSFLEGWRVEYRAAREVQRTATFLTGDKADEIVTAVDEYLQAVTDTELEGVEDWATTWQGSPEAAQALLATAAATEIAAETLPAYEADELRRATERLVDGRDQRFERGIQPGTPVVIMCVVMLLAWSATLCLSLYPAGGQPRVKRFQATMVVLIVGLVQLPVYYLIGSGALREFITGVLSA